MELHWDAIIIWVKTAKLSHLPLLVGLYLHKEHRREKSDSDPAELGDNFPADYLK